MFWVVLWARAFRGSFFWSFFGVRAFWFVLLGFEFWGLMRVFFDAFKVLEACVARSEVSCVKIAKSLRKCKFIP